MNSSLLNGRSPRASVNSSSIRSPKRQERLERQTNFKVVIRVRPPLPRELSGEIPFKNTVAVDEREQQITISENIDEVFDEDGQLKSNPGPFSTHSFMFDHVYDQNATQKSVFDTTARTVVDSALQGYNATIFAYGQTGTGKTFTMEGFTKEGAVEARGIIPRAIEQIFIHIQRNASPRMRFLVRASYLQIYNEQISDLLKPERSNLTIREDKKKGVFVEGLSEWVVRSPAEIYGLMERGGTVRATGETKMNEVSSRSHAVFIVIAEQSETLYVDDNGNEMSADEFQKFMHNRGVRRENDMNRLEDHVKQSFKVGKLNLVDLAGSERVRLSGATGQRLEESKQINKSLSALGNVISALTDTKGRQHIPYRDSKLTRMLEDSLGGNCKTTMMAMISPALEAMVETVSTLKFANRAKNIRNEARVNEDLDQKSLLRKYEKELKRLRAELESRNKNVVDKRRLLELDEQRRRAEADKMAAIRALEARSLEFMREKEEKKNLEKRISTLMGQMIRGDRTTVSPDGKTTGVEYPTNNDGSRLRQEYEGKLANLEKERETIEEEKAQVDRYKQLLLKQRDIMIALTQRLVERDEQIMGLQDELDAYDRNHKELEEKLDEKTALLIKFQRISMEVNANSPNKNVELSDALDQWASINQDRRGGATEIETGVDDYDDGDKSIVSERSLFQRQLSNNQHNEPKSSFDSNSSPNEKNIIIELENAMIKAGIDDSKASDISRQLIGKLNPNLLSHIKRMDSEEFSSLRDGHAKPQQNVRKTESDSSLKPNEYDASLKEKCELLIKEREAVHTIMEQKIGVLVQSVSQAVATVLQNSPQSGSSPSGITLAKDIAALQRLVNASIAALRNAASSSNSPTMETTKRNTFAPGKNLAPARLPPPPPVGMNPIGYSTSNYR